MERSRFKKLRIGYNILGFKFQVWNLLILKPIISNSEGLEMRIILFSHSEASNKYIMYW